MHILTKAGVATLSVGAIGGASFAGYSHFSKTSFKDNLGNSVLGLTGDSNKTQWDARLKELQGTSTTLPKELQNLKSDKQWNDLQKWCLDNSSNTFTKAEDSNYSNFETFCTWKIGDKTWTNKITSDKKATEEAWGTAHSKLADKTNLSAALNKVKAVKKASDNEDRKAMHEWCTNNYKNTWVSDDNEIFKETQTYCRTYG